MLPECRNVDFNIHVSQSEFNEAHYSNHQVYPIGAIRRMIYVPEADFIGQTCVVTGHSMFTSA